MWDLLSTTKCKIKFPQILTVIWHASLNITKMLHLSLWNSQYYFHWNHWCSKCYHSVLCLLSLFRFPFSFHHKMLVNDTENYMLTTCIAIVHKTTIIWMVLGESFILLTYWIFSLFWTVSIVFVMRTEAAFGFLGNQNSATEGGQTILVIHI